MKLAQKNHDIQRSKPDPQNEREFTIASNPIAFEILSSGLYSNKIKAVVRELGTNAYDEQYKVAKDHLITKLPQNKQNRLQKLYKELDPIFAKDPLDRSKFELAVLQDKMKEIVSLEPTQDEVVKAITPFHIHLPNELEPWFAVKDSGRGMSRDFAMTLYSTYFSSDKRDTNDLNGCFGLGSKSPLAYSDKFTVTSYYNGIKSIYNVFINENRRPTINCVYEGETDEGNGVEVKIAVATKEFKDFLDTSMSVYKWFAVRPTVGGLANFEWPEDEEFLFESDTYKVYDQKSVNYYRRQSCVVMGNVAYPISLSDFPHDIKKDITDTQEKLINYGVILPVKLGEVHMSASREKLQMSPRTVGVIKNRLEEIANVLEKDVRKKIAQAANVWEARLLYCEIVHNTVIGGIVGSRKVKKPFIYNGIELKKDISLEREIENKKDDDEMSPVESIRLARGKVCFLEKSHRYSRKTCGYSSMFRRMDTDSIEPEREMTILVDDLDGKGAFVRVENYLREENIKKVYILRSSEDYDLDTFLEETGIIEVVEYVSDLPMPERAERVTGPKKKTAKAVRCTGIFMHRTERDSWEDVEVDMDHGGVYVEVNRYKWRAGKLSADRMYAPNLLEGYYHILMELNPDLEVIGLRKALAKKAENNPNWVRLDEYVPILFKEFHYLVDYEARYNVYSLADISHKDSFSRLFADEADDSPMFNFTHNLAESKGYGRSKNLDSFTKAKSIFHFLDLELPKAKDYSRIRKDLEQRAKEVESLYPMISFMSWHHFSFIDDGEQRLADYVKMVDQSESLSKILRKNKTHKVA